MMYNNWMWGGAGFGFGWIFMMILMILFWALIIWAILAVVRGVSGHGRCCGHGDHNEHEQKKSEKNSALEILNERYAKGEINKQEYEEKKKDLNS